MALYIIGIGLHDEKDITVKGLEAVKKCSKVFLETYTSRLSIPISKLEEFYGKEVIPANRELIEQKFETEIMPVAKEEDAAVLIIGDVYAATTHIDMKLRAAEVGIEVVSIHNASVLTAIGMLGLELYKYGKTTSIPFDNPHVTTPVEVYKKNKEMGLHTLFLLDLRPEEDRWMKINFAAEFLIERGVDENTLAIGAAGLGSPEPEIKTATLKELKTQQFDLIPQSLVIPGDLHFVEEETIEHWK